MIIYVAKKNKLINVSRVLNANISKVQKLKKSKKLLKLKNFANLSKSQNISINIRVIRYLIFQARLPFT